MYAGAVTSQPGPSAQASKDKKAKRPRKRTRNKKRTTELEDSSSSSSSDDSDDEEPAPQPAPVKSAVKEESKKLKESSPAPESDSDDDDKDEDGNGKRKRKRKRNKKKAGEEAPAAVAPAASNVASTTTSTPSKPLNLSPEQVGPDPNTDLRLSEQAKQAIQYAQIYVKDKSQWKFNKAKQNWLLRNALSVPPSNYDAALARSKSNNAAEGTSEDNDEAEEGENFVPEDFVPVVTAYLTSVMGGARQRLIESLREAINAPAIVIAPTQPEVTDNATNGADTNDKTDTTTEAPAAKSVSFGNLALETEKKEEAAEAAGLPAGTDPQAVELRRSRATLMLHQMGESL